MRLVRDAKARGVRVTAEVTPHHLLLTDEAVRDLRRQHQDGAAAADASATSRRCREALADGTIDCIATDHAPHALAEKEGEFDHAAFGIVGLETAVRAAARPARAAGRARPRRRWSRGSPWARPALLDLPGGSLAAGRARRRHGPRPRTRSTRRARALPLEEPQHAVRRLGAASARPWMTIVGGRIVMRDGRAGTQAVTQSARRSWPWPTAASSAARPSAPRARPSGEVVFNTAMTRLPGDPHRSRPTAGRSSP